ncbi:MAG TPA: IS481 family transposase [Sphingomicrobium sp.]|jgi:transposase InsO family protein|nr:IS481 family transposase [Sphingomicrobium sp.]
MDQRVALIADWLRDEWSMTELAERYGVARKTVYKWVARYQSDPGGSLADRSRAPHAHGRRMTDEVAALIVALRRRYPRWGPKKLRWALEERDATRPWPAASTIGELLGRAGLSERRRRPRYAVPLTQPLVAAQQPNDVWSGDFKGWFRTADGTRCDPLTIIDNYSRWVLCCRITAPTDAGVRPWCERVFREYGLPRVFRTDNGTPFASSGAAQLTRLSVWWLRLGIQLDRIDPGHPEQNGRHERFHRTLQEETAQPPAASAAQQQRRFDRMRRAFNEERPHEALGQQPPARVYVPSSRPFPSRLDEPFYDPTHQVRRVRDKGQIKWAGEEVFICEALCGELVGLAETVRGDWTVRFMHIEVGRIERRTGRFRAAWHGRRL